MRIEKGATLMAWEYIDLLQARQAVDRRRMLRPIWSGYDALLSPTVPIVAPLVADVRPQTARTRQRDAARDAEFFRVNNLLLRNTSVVNLLDGCALSLPCHAPGELPVGLMVWHGALTGRRGIEPEPADRSNHFKYNSVRLTHLTQRATRGVLTSKYP